LVVGGNLLRAAFAESKAKSSLSLVSPFVAPGKAFQRYVSKKKRFCSSGGPAFTAGWMGLLSLVLPGMRAGIYASTDLEARANLPVWGEVIASKRPSCPAREVIAHELAHIRRRFGDDRMAEKQAGSLLSASIANLPNRILLETEVSGRGRYENTDFVQIRVEKC
jgi:hypothetical protein